MSPVWWPVALAKDVPPRTSAGVRLNGQEVVLWRDGAGTVRAWEDRCPHRGMKLSFGFVRAERLVCLYHGWQYDTEGRCRYIPAHPELDPPASIVVSKYQAIDAAGMIFVALMGPDEGASDRPAIDVKPALRSVHVEAPLDTLSSMLDAGGWADEIVAAAEPDGPLRRVVHARGTLLVGVHPVDDGASGLHACLHEDADAQTKAVLSRELTLLRQRAEGADA